MSRVRIGVDIGGTFTDLLLVDEATGEFFVEKTPTTPADPAQAVLTGIRSLLAKSSRTSSAVQQIVHGTTLVTNALIERKGAKTALVTTKGFRDAIEIGREHRYDLYDLFLELPQPLVPRHLRFEIDERILADGSELHPVDRASLEKVVAALRGNEIEAVAICLMHSYQNPAHEREIASCIEDALPEIVISLSSEVVPEIREFERASTTIANVYVRDVISRYLATLERELRRMGIPGSLLVMHSSGGICTVETASTFPIRLIESGPAAGALAAAHYGRLTGRESLISFDVGGTTAKCCLIDGGRPTISAEFEVNRVYRFKKGSGLPVKVPVIELIEIGAGGGSIARIDGMGLLKVGPESSGSDPGPACYGRGGIDPTVTDADLLLGYLDPSFFLGGGMSLDRAAADQAITGLGMKLGIDPIATAWGIHHVVNEQMAAAARMHAVELGKDPRDYPLFAFGGAGPVHAYRVAEILRSPQLIVPFGAGITSTVGFLVAPIAFDFVRSYVGRLDRIDWEIVRNRFLEMESEGHEILRSAGAQEGAIRFERSAELRYVGQGHQVSVPLDGIDLSENSAVAISDAFAGLYRLIYGRSADGNPIEAINWRVIASAPKPDLPIERLSPKASSGSAVKGIRDIYLPEHGGFVPTSVYDRYHLKPGDTFFGPAIVEERESTVVIGTGAEVAVDSFSNLVVTMPS